MDDKNELEYRYRVLALQLQAKICHKEKLTEQIQEMRSELQKNEIEIELLKQEVIITISKLSKYDRRGLK